MTISARSSTGSEQESSIPKVAGSSPAVLTTPSEGAREMSGHTPSEPVLWTLVFSEHYGANAETTFKTKEKAEDYIDRCGGGRIMPLYSHAANEAKIEALVSLLRRILKHGELGNIGTGGWAGNKPAGNPMSKDVWQFPRHMLTDIEEALQTAAGEKYNG